MTTVTSTISGPTAISPAKGRRTCPTIALRSILGEWSLASPEAQRLVQQIEAWNLAGAKLPTHHIVINLYHGGPLCGRHKTYSARRCALIDEVRRLFVENDFDWRAVSVMEQEAPTLLAHVHMLIWIPDDPAFRRLLWAYFVRRFKIAVPAGKANWHVLNRMGTGNAVHVGIISAHRFNRATGRKGAAGAGDYFLKQIDRNAFMPGAKERLGNLVSATCAIVGLHKTCGFPRPKLRLRAIPISAPPAASLGG